MCAAHKENKAPDFFPLRNKLFMPNMKNGTILDTEKNKIDLGDSPVFMLYRLFQKVFFSRPFQAKKIISFHFIFVS